MDEFDLKIDLYITTIYVQPHIHEYFHPSIEFHPEIKSHNKIWDTALNKDKKHMPTGSFF